MQLLKSLMYNVTEVSSMIKTIKIKAVSRHLITVTNLKIKKWSAFALLKYSRYENSSRSFVYTGSDSGQKHFNSENATFQKKL